MMALNSGSLATMLTSQYALDPSLAGCLWMLLASVLLDLFDISLPRGDSVGVAGALSAAALLVVGPPRAFVIVGMSAVIAHLIRRGVDSPRRLLAVLISRGVGLSAGTIALWYLFGTVPSLVLYGVVPAVFLMAEMVSAQAVLSFMTTRPFLRLLRGNLRSQAPILAAQWSASVLILLIYIGMGPWSLIPVVALLLLMRQSYALFLDIRETYRTTVEVLVEAAESQDIRRIGHADRTATIARAIATRLGLNASDVEQISYAALLHDLGVLSEQPTTEDDGGVRETRSADVVREVEFFSAIGPILSICDGGSRQDPHDEHDVTAALIVALASDIDAAYSADVAAAHRGGALDGVTPLASSAEKARVVGAALELGYRIPAVG